MVDGRVHARGAVRATLARRYVLVPRRPLVLSSERALQVNASMSPATSTRACCCVVDSMRVGGSCMPGRARMHSLQHESAGQPRTTNGALRNLDGARVAP